MGKSNRQETAVESAILIIGLIVLPREALVAVLIPLESTDRVRIRGSCRECRILIDTDKRFALSLNTEQSVNYLKNLQKGFRLNVRSLNLSDCNMVTDITPLSECDSLHTLNLSGCKGLTNTSGLEGCGSLHTLCISEDLALSNLPTLRGCNSLVILEVHDEFTVQTTFPNRESVTRFVNDNS